MSNEQIKVETTNNADDTNPMDETEPMMDPAKIADILQNTDEAQNIMEKMFGTLMQNPELSEAMMNPEMLGMLGGLAGKDAKDGDVHDIMNMLSGMGGSGGDADMTSATNNDNIPTPDGMEDITSTIQESSAFPHEIERTITELEDARDKSIELNVKFETDEIRALYDTKNTQYATDSGWDLRFPEDATVPAGALSHKFDFGVSVCCYGKDLEGSALWLLPRSSIVKTPLRLANSVGLIDASYRGTLKAFVDNRNSDEPFIVKKGDRLFQLASPGLAPFTVKVVNALSSTERGANGFGSTGA